MQDLLSLDNVFGLSVCMGGGGFQRCAGSAASELLIMVMTK